MLLFENDFRRRGGDAISTILLRDSDGERLFGLFGFIVASFESCANVNTCWVI
jgi:hypothetical protein